MLKHRKLLILLGIGIIAAIVIQLPLLDWLEGLLSWVDDHRRIAWLAFIASYVVATILFVPGSLLTLAAGAIFGLAQGTALVSFASVSGATLAFLVGRTLAREAIERKINRMPRFNALDKALHRNGFLVVLLTRLSPFFPFNLLNYAYGLTSVSIRSYLVASWIGMLPGTVLYVYVGSLVTSLTQVFHGEVETGLGGRVLFVLGLIATVLMTLLLTRMASRTLRAQLESN